MMTVQQTLTAGTQGTAPAGPPPTELSVELQEASWQKSRYSNSQGTCVELAKLPSGAIAVRNSRHPEGPTLIYTTAEIRALIQGAKDGEFDNLIQ